MTWLDLPLYILAAVLAGVVFALWLPQAMTEPAKATIATSAMQAARPF